MHGYKYIHEDIFRDYDMNILNMLYYKKSIHRRKKNIYIKNVYILKKFIIIHYYFLIKV